MSVSHYVVSWSQVFGLVVWLLGFFFLSVGLFGKSGPNLLRPLLPGLARAIVGALGPLVVSIPGQGRDPVTVAVTALVCAAAGYFMGYFSQQPHLSDRLVAYRVAVYGLGVFGGIVLGLLADWRSTSGTLSLIGYMALFAGTIATTIELPARVPERAMTTLGIVATVLGILPQFIPPMLDMLNIPIR